jgi:hypothetical protein
MQFVYMLYMLLFFLAGSVLLGIVRVLRGGSFLPEPEPGEDRLFRDNKSRWWREDATGTIEEAFRKAPPGAREKSPPMIELSGVIRSYVIPISIRMPSRHCSKRCAIAGA